MGVGESTLPEAPGGRRGPAEGSGVQGPRGHPSLPFGPVHAAQWQAFRSHRPVRPSGNSRAPEA